MESGSPRIHFGNSVSATNKWWVQELRANDAEDGAGTVVNSAVSITLDLSVAATKVWLEKAVIGLNLCPFAKAVHLQKKIRWVVSTATTEEALRADLVQELANLSAVDPAEVETTLLIHPYVLADFLDYNAFLTIANQALRQLRLEGILQIASFHPNYQFAESSKDDPANFSNQSPFPTLHLLRESSIEAAVAAYGDPALIYQNNIDTLRRLGPAGWRQLWV